jgi:hypothetical protein
MKRIVIALAVLLSAGLALLPTVHSQNPALGPGDKGAVLRQAPWLEGGASPAPGTPPGTPTVPAQGNGTPRYLQGLLESSGANRVNADRTGVASSLMPYDTMAINNDILVTPELGQWMVMITSYRGKDGPMRARKMVCELRSVYKLPAYAFNFGAEEKRKELERVTKLIEKQKAELKELIEKQKAEHRELDLSMDQPIRVSHLRIDEYVGVLVGGYPTMDAARTARDHFRELAKKAPPDPRVFKLVYDGDLLDTKYYTGAEGAKQKVDPERVYVSPFDRAFPVHNPTIHVDKPADANKLDVAALKHLNSAEDYSLFKCPRNFTLVIKQFNTPTVTGPRNEPAPSDSWWPNFGFSKKTERVDMAAENAHRLAEGLRRGKLDAYVLHMKYCSLVTIGGFDSLEDPAMLAMKNYIETRLVPAPSLAAVELFPKAMAWQIPR